ncbi:TetR/AcrR family transcriptional regulator [Arthrobacter sp. UM1]|uniref:TetR/AcrR family transcriptional regulator n=1 Tax=Arthrobacter sp. UM1 TaxID=2766776 RepID=UPI001CF6D3CA|nr:TetR/AcrR family transcriptional regulator [Arthrobacter sp. UM1]MCB4207174.1 TetR/AcrR family transcriptional regulator [Arthrobacter sp. UM1]
MTQSRDGASAKPAQAESARGPRGPYRKTRERREQIIRAAFDVFACHGYHSGSIQAVADRVGISQATLLHHFPTKTHLLQAVLELRDAYTGEDTPHPVDRTLPLRDVIRRQCLINERIAGLIALYTVLVGESVTDEHPAKPYFQRRFRKSRKDFTDDLLREKEAGRLLPGVDIPATAAGIAAMWDGLQLQWLLDEHVDVAGGLLAYLDLVLTPEESKHAS